MRRLPRRNERVARHALADDHQLLNGLRAGRAAPALVGVDGDDHTPVLRAPGVGGMLVDHERAVEEQREVRQRCGLREHRDRAILVRPPGDR